MTKLKQIYKCEVCGNIVEMVHAGAGALICCGQEMKLQEENTVDAAVEKHVPVIEKIVTGVKVTIGEVIHPMEEAHFIEWIELITESGVHRHHFEPGQEPVAIFEIEYKNDLVARAYCNLHGLWEKSGVKQEGEVEKEAALSN